MADRKPKISARGSSTASPSAAATATPTVAPEADDAPAFYAKYGQRMPTPSPVSALCFRASCFGGVMGMPQRCAGIGAAARSVIPIHTTWAPPLGLAHRSAVAAHSSLLACPATASVFASLCIPCFLPPRRARATACSTRACSRRTPRGEAVQRPGRRSCATEVLGVRKSRGMRHRNRVRASHRRRSLHWPLPSVRAV